MRTDLERDDFLHLLEKLNSEEDADILSAVRDINAKMTVAGVTWDDLLASQNDPSDEYEDDQPEEDDEEEDDVDDDEDEDEDEDENEELDGDGDGDDDEAQSPLSDTEKQEATTLIGSISAMEISDATKQELEEYSADLKEGEFEQMDLRYLRALNGRLSA